MRQGGSLATRRAILPIMLRRRRALLDASRTVAPAATASNCHMRAPPIGTPANANSLGPQRHPAECCGSIAGTTHLLAKKFHRRALKKFHVK